MKLLLSAFVVAIFGIGSAFAGITARKVENAKSTATRSGKLVAFVFYQGYYNPNCPKCIAEVNANNAAVKRAIPRKYAVPIDVEGRQKDVDEALPSVVSKKGASPRIVVTDADCQKVVAEVRNGSSKEELEAFEKKVAEASGAGK